MMQWRKVEKKLPPHETIRQRSELAHKIKMTSIIIMTLSLSKEMMKLYKRSIERNYSSTVEHLLNIISIVSHLRACNKNMTDPIRLYFQAEQNQLFDFFEFSPFLAFVGKTMNVLTTFLWSYMDLFVIVISLGLSSRFKQINDNLMKHKGQVRFCSLLLLSVFSFGKNVFYP